MAQRKRRIAVVSTSRADFGIYQPVLAGLKRNPNLEFGIIAGGSHMMAEHGSTLTQVEASGHPVWATAPLDFQSGAFGTAQMMAQSVNGFARAYENTTPDIILTLGDRFEMHSAVSAASPFLIPVAHIHGGEESEGAIDNMYRHSMTKMSHLHFCATELSARRLRQLGEADNTIFVTGAPGLDGIAEMDLLSHQGLVEKFGFPENNFVLTTYHPETLNRDGTLDDFEAVLSALEECGLDIVFSRSNADPSGDALNERLDVACAENPKFRICDNLGRVGYFSAMANAICMVGNSSSGIIEAASFKLPVVNVGGRQDGRERSDNIHDVPAEKNAIEAAIANSTSSERRLELQEVRNVFGDGNASHTICDVLETYPLDPEVLRKKFVLR